MESESTEKGLASRLVRSAGWAALIWLLIFWRLGYLSLLDPDEAHYAQITKEMLAAREWLVPLRGGQPFIDKPVLFHWLQGVSFTVFGMSEFAARLPSALAAIALLWTTYWLGRELFDRDTGRRAAAMLLTMPATFALASIGLYDMAFTACLFGAVACLIVSAVRERPSLQWAGFLLLALAIMIKGPVAVLLLGVAFGTAVLVVTSARRDLLRLRWLVGPLAAVALASPWFVWMAWRFGGEFFTRYVVQGNVWYLTHPYPYRQSNHFFYVRTFFGAFAPWSVLAVARAIDLLRTRGRTGCREGWLLMCWIGTVLGVFTLTRFKLDHYIYPAAPALSLMSARAWTAARDREPHAFFQRAVVIAFPALLISGAMVLGLSMFELDLQLSPDAIVVPVAITAGAIVCAVRVWRAGWRSPIFPTAVVGTLVVMYASVVAFGFPVLEHVRPTPLVGRWIATRSAETAPVGLFQLGEFESSLRFYSNRRVERLDDVEDLQAFLAGSGPRSVVMRRRRFEALQAMGMPLRLGYTADAVVGRTGKGLRRQQWGRVVVAVKGREGQE